MINLQKGKSLETSIYDFRIEGLGGSVIDFSKLTGKKLLLINVASECGYTIQYKQLQELYEHFNQSLEIIAFPCNDFGGQEPGSDEEIEKFCNINYKITFPITKKIQILGDDIHPIYYWLTRKNLNGKLDSSVEWNFQKYLISEKGELEYVLPSSIDPFDAKIIDWIQTNQ